MTFTIERLNLEAVGVGPEDQHVPRTLPGEEVELADGVARIITPSADRVKPPCSHYKACGGCSLQHASDTFVADWKIDVVRKALSARSLAIPETTLHTSPVKSRRRAKFSATRTKKGAMVGFMSPKSHILVPITQCWVLDPKLVEALPVLEAVTTQFASRKEVLGLQVASSEAGLDLVIQTDRDVTDTMRMELAQFAQKHSLARLTWRDEVIVTLRDPIQHFGVASVVPPAGAFLQATVDAENALAKAVAECVGDAAIIADLFAGSGTFALRLAQSARVHVVESQGDMLTALDAGWRMAKGLKKVTTETRDLYRRPLLPDELAKFDAIVIDPPRAGAMAQFAEIATAGVQIIASVSCNPVSFARDAEILINAGYSFKRLWIVDQFRWSPHTEVVGLFVKT